MKLYYYAAYGLLFICAGLGIGYFDAYDSTVDSQVKFDIFERLNTGAVQLEAQELRNALYRGPFNDLIKELARYRKFMELINVNSADYDKDNKVKKMQDVEIVLRYFALENGEINFMKKSLKDFLSEQMEKFNSMSEKELTRKKEDFFNTIDIIYEKLGKFAFAKYKIENGSLKKQSNFNASVYDSIVIAFSDLKKGKRQSLG